MQVIFPRPLVEHADRHGPEADQWQAERERLTRLLQTRGIVHPGVLSVMASLPRHEFLPQPWPAPEIAYGDHPLSIGFGQTISQPFIVAYMTQCLDVQPGQRVLEIGSGCGYQAAILAALGAEVVAVERLQVLADHAAKILSRLGFEHVRVVCGDGYQGGPGDAPYDRIVVSCAPAAVPKVLTSQLADGGRMIIPVGVDRQTLVFVERKADHIIQHDDLPVRFVPMLPVS